MCGLPFLPMLAPATFTQNCFKGPNTSGQLIDTKALNLKLPIFNALVSAQRKISMFFLQRMRILRTEKGLSTSRNILSLSGVRVKHISDKPSP